jgi:uncharacterized protein YprB with RNaseH-like and TPR domain
MITKKKVSKEVKDTNKPKILFFDLETAGINGFKADLAWVIAVSYIWEDDKKPTVIMISDYPEFKKDPHNDKRILEEFSKVISQADYISGHFAEKFDRPFVNTRFKIHGIERIPPIKLIDTWRIARTHLKLSSNRLDNLAKVLKCKYRKKPKVGDFWPQAWLEYMKGSTKRVTEMKTYSAYDVLTQRECALKLRDFWPHTINLNLREMGCAKCGKDKFVKRGYQYTASAKFQRYKCLNCGAWSRDNKNLIKTKMRVC